MYQERVQNVFKLWKVGNICHWWKESLGGFIICVGRVGGGETRLPSSVTFRVLVARATDAIHPLCWHNWIRWILGVNVLFFSLPLPFRRRGWTSVAWFSSYLWQLLSSPGASSDHWQAARGDATGPGEDINGEGNTVSPRFHPTNHHYITKKKQQPLLGLKSEQTNQIVTYPTKSHQCLHRFWN